MSERTFRRWVARYGAEGPTALRDRRVGRSARRAPPEELAAVEAVYGTGHREWNVRHFYDEVYVAEGGGTRSYTWVKNRLQEAGLVKRGRRKGSHRERRERKPVTGRMLHKDGSRDRWVADRWLGSGGDDGRCDGRGVLGVLRGGGGDLVELTGGARDGGGEGAVRQPVHGPGLALLAHAEGRREGGRGQPDPVRPGDGRASGCSERCRGACPRNWRRRGSPGWTRRTSF